MRPDRASGVLCHITSLPSPCGIGDLGPSAFHFADRLRQAGQRYWQVLPINPTDHALGDSPYSSSSAFGLNQVLISPQRLWQEGLLTKEQILECHILADDQAAFDRVYERKRRMVDQAWAAYQRRWFKSGEFRDFCTRQAFWLDDHALFMGLKARFNGQGWAQWPAALRDRQPAALAAARLELAEAMTREKFGQFLFYRQWMALRRHCLRRGIRLIGDIPIYVNYDSVDVWRSPEIFKLDKDKRPLVVAGVPPDYFSKDGQRWGNPVYDWARLEASGFSWWIARLRHNLEFFDLVRIDHFRALAQCWEIPVQETTAIKGAWRDVPGVKFLEAVKAAFPQLPIIAEDLGIITPDVEELMQRFGLPGMRVLMFAFHNDYLKSRDLPANYPDRCVAYTGTHDNNTLRAWFTRDVTDIEIANIRKYFGREVGPDEVNWLMIEAVLRSPAMLAIISLPDILGLGEEGRMNTPATVTGNWKWRLLPGAFDQGAAARLRSLTRASGR